jgi:hypothetical protein
VTPCTKRPFASVHDARVAHRRAGFRVRVYRCPDCHHYHVTNNEKHFNSKIDKFKSHE